MPRVRACILCASAFFEQTNLVSSQQAGGRSPLGKIWLVWNLTQASYAVATGIGKRRRPTWAVRLQQGSLDTNAAVTRRPLMWWRGQRCFLLWRRGRKKGDNRRGEEPIWADYAYRFPICWGNAGYQTHRWRSIATRAILVATWIYASCIVRKRIKLMNRIARLISFHEMSFERQMTFRHRPGSA